MSTRTRVRGDNYPIEITFKVNDEPIDISGAELKFSYYNADNEVKTISGVSQAETGVCKFIPQGTDFQVAGTFTYDVQRVDGGYTYTHQKGTLLLDDDVTK